MMRNCPGSGSPVNPCRGPDNGGFSDCFRFYPVGSGKSNHQDSRIIVSGYGCSEMAMVVSGSVVPRSVLTVDLIIPEYSGIS
jgi:hypothetical protein